MDIEFDPAKNAANLQKHGLDMALALFLFEGEYYERLDLRRDYGEERWIAYGFIEARAVVCVYVVREDRRRIISLRKANSREANDDC